MKKILFVLLSFAICQQAFSDDIPAGKTIFNSRCTACHAIKDKLVGPALLGVDKRHDTQWIVNFVHSSQTLVKKGDAAAVKLFADNSSIVMPDHQDLTDADITNVVAFIKDESQKLSQPAVATNTNRPVEIKPNYSPISFQDYSVWAVYIMSVFVIILTLVTLVQVFSVLKVTGNKDLTA